MERIYLNDKWQFSEEFTEDMLLEDFAADGLEEVRLPHTCKEVPYHYFDESEYQMVSGYRRILHASKAWKGKHVLLTIDGAAHDSKVYVNGELVGEHHCGYTAFTMDIADKLVYGSDNVIVVRVDSNENLNIPPFGFVIDYMTFGGIYRDVYIDIKAKSYIEDVFVTTKIMTDAFKTRTVSEIKLFNPKEEYVLRQSIREKGTDEFKMLDKMSAVSQELITLKQDPGNIKLWDLDSPNLYELKTELLDGEKVIDEKIVTFGFRKAVFHKDGFYLNGKKIKIRGLNRHQSYPYVGYAMPESMQKMDADILKNELGLNAVRTSHYPQSQYFVDRCDEIGLLVFTEFPGWQHIGDDDWKNQAVENVKDMVLQYRNHPSIILWGVRINESLDDDEFYTRTNAVAHELDPSRQTGGVRCYKKSSLLEDVYTYNDFCHSGFNQGCDKKSAVTSDMEKGYLISEYNGHMYPTKPYDWEEHRSWHALRHANVLDAVAKENDIAGSFGWCMFDYNTHKDFGSGDRICYHGVMDMFRNPKLAAAIYASQQDETPVLELNSAMDIGEHPGCIRGDVYIFTNADSVKMYKNDVFIKEYSAKDSSYKNLKHGPILIDDYVGDVMKEQEHMKDAQAEGMKALLNAAARYGMDNIPKHLYLKALKLIAVYHMNMSDAVKYYNKYIGDWGGKSTIYRFDAIKNGEVVKSICRMPMKKIEVVANADHTVLHEGVTYDVAAVRINAVDDNGNVLYFCNDPVTFKTTGPIELIGPDVISFQGGACGTYVKTTGKKGKAKLAITSAKCTYEIEFEVK